METFLLLDRSSERIKKRLKEWAPPVIQLYRAVYDENTLTYTVEVTTEPGAPGTDANLYYGAKVSLAQFTNGYNISSFGFIISIPRHGVYFSELLKISGNYQETTIQLPNSAVIFIDGSRSDPLVIFFRDEFCCLSWKQDNFRKKPRSWIAVYSIGAGKINENDKTITQQPKFDLVSLHQPACVLPNSCAGFRLVFKEEQEFKDALGEAIYAEFGFEAYSIADKTFVLSKLLTWTETVDLLSNLEHPCNRLLEICVLSEERAFIPTETEAVTGSFLKAESIFTPFLEYVLAVAKLNPNSIIARFFHLTQSSGSGKTTLALHLIDHLRTGIYCVYREQWSSGWPRMNGWTTRLVGKFKFADNTEEAITICLTFILAAVESVMQVKKKEHLKEMYLQPTAALDNIFQGKFEEAKSKTQTELIEAICAVDFGECFPIIIDSWDKFLCLPQFSSRSAEKQITLYAAFKRALVLIKGKPIVTVFVGNKPLLHHSYKVAGFEPFNFVSSFDVFLPGEIDDVAYEALVDGQIMQTEALKQIAFKCGRPLWNLYESFDKAMMAAVIKLKTDKDIATLAAFVMRTGAPVVPSSLLAQKLVHCAMARLEGMNCCRVSYGAEPVLASAARLYCGSVDNLKEVLKKFLECIKNGSVSRVSEEFVARVIALRAIDRAAEVNLLRAGSTGFGSINWLWIIDDRCCYLDSELPKGTQKYPSYVLITLRDFLMNLRVSELTGLDVSEEMLNGLVNVSQFIRYDRLALKDAFLRCVGLSCSSALIIPVLRSDNRFSAVIISFKDGPVERLDLGAEYVTVDLCLRGLEAFTHLFENDTTSSSILSSLNSILKATKRERVDDEQPPSTRQRLH